jgi:hypothetical protein
MLALAAPASAQASGGAELAQTQAQTTGEGPSWLPVYAGLAGLAAGLLIVLIRRGHRRVSRWVTRPLGRAVSSSGRFVRSLAPLALAPVGALSAVARWRPSRLEAPDRVVPEGPPLPEPDEPPPPPSREPIFVSPPPDQASVQAPSSVAAVLSGSSSPAMAPAPPKPQQPALPEEEEEAPPRTLRFAVPAVTTWERCEIEWWRGYVKSDFYAVAFRPTGEWYVAGRSPSFRWRHNEPPPQEASGQEEHAELVGRLVADGWEPVGNGPVWYQTRFRRPVPPSIDELAGTL